MAKQDKRPHAVTKEKQRDILLLASYGVTHEAIAQHVGIDKKTLYKYYREDLDNAKLNAHSAVGKFLFEAASGMALENGAKHSDCIRAAMFYAKTQMGWKEQEDDDSGQEIVINFHRASDEVID